MKRLIKKTVAARNIPVLALALFAALFIGNEVYASLVTQSTPHWYFDRNLCVDPTDPNCYRPAPGDITEDCENDDEELCGIVAPKDETVLDKDVPEIQGQLFLDLLNGQYEDNEDIFTMPYIGSTL